MIKLLRGIFVGSGLGFALFYTSSLSNEVYLAALALTVLVGILIPLEQQDHRLEKLQASLNDLGLRLDRMAESMAYAREEEDQPIHYPDTLSGKEPDTYMPAIQANASEGRTVMAHGRRTVERSVEDMAKKLASIQKG